MMKAGVIGVGMMGRNHARIYAEIEEVDLVAVADTDSEVATQVAQTYGVRAYHSPGDLLLREPLDLVSIAVPTHLHKQVALEAIEAGVHVLLEKPLAPTVEEGRAIIQAAKTRGLCLTVGHIERFNPAIQELDRRLKREELGQIFQLHARRIGPFPPRIKDVGVVMDLATHELNVMEYLMQTEIESLYAEIGFRVHATREDFLSGVLRFANGVVGVLDVNWLTPTKIRELFIVGEKGMFQVNYLTQELYFYANNWAREPANMVAAVMGASEGQRIRHQIERVEPLKAELQAFINAVRSGKAPLVSGEEALRAVFLAQQILASGRTHEVVHLGGQAPRRMGNS